jgi:hypothetical protein
VIDDVVAPVLHKRDPVYADAVNVDVPLQLSTTEIVGATGAVLGSAKPLAAALLHPAIVCCTTRLPNVLTVIDGVVSPVLHIRVPV